jgi:hypothetical protein
VRNISGLREEFFVLEIGIFFVATQPMNATTEGSNATGGFTLSVAKFIVPDWGDKVDCGIL